VVKGLNIVPLADQPPVNVVRFAFQTMVGIGTCWPCSAWSTWLSGGGGASC